MNRLKRPSGAERERGPSEDPQVGQPSEETSRPVWKDPAWLTAVATLLTAVVAAGSRLLTRGDEGEPLSQSVTPTTGATVSANVRSDDAPLTVGVATEPHCR